MEFEHNRANLDTPLPTPVVNNIIEFNIKKWKSWKLYQCYDKWFQAYFYQILP